MSTCTLQLCQDLQGQAHFAVSMVQGTVVITESLPVEVKAICRDEEEGKWKEGGVSQYCKGLWCRKQQKITCISADDRVSIECIPGVFSSLPTPDTMPCVKVWSSPNGLPIAYTFCPTNRLEDCPRLIGFVSSILDVSHSSWSTAMSLSGSPPTN